MLIKFLSDHKALEPKQPHPSSLLIKSPNPGVSTTVRRSLTPFSSISVEGGQSFGSTSRTTNGPKKKESIRTGGDGFDGDGLRTVVVRLRDVLFRVQGRVEEGVDQGRLAETGFACVSIGVSTLLGRRRVRRADGPTTMAVKWKPGNEQMGQRGARVWMSGLLTFAD